MKKFIASLVSSTRLKKTNVIYILTAILIVGKTLMFFSQNPNFIWYWDWPGHIQKAQQLYWIPWENGWDTGFWGGYPTGRYPWGYHYLFKILINFSESEKTAAAAITIISFLLLTLGIWKLTGKFKISPSKRILAAVSMQLVFLYSGPGMLGSYLGTVYTGGGPALLATALLLLFMSIKTWPERAVLLGLIFLTHPLTAIVALIFLGISFITEYKNKNQEEIKKWILTMTVSAIIGLPWILVMLDPSFAAGAFNLTEVPPLIHWIIAFSVLILAINSQSLKRPLTVLTLILAVLAALDKVSAISLQSIGIRGIHFYRFAWYFQLFVPLVIAQNLPDLKFSAAAQRVIALGVILLLIRSYNPKVRLKLDWLDFPARDATQRVIDVSRHAQVFQLPHAAEHFLAAENKNLIGTTGLFFESSPYGLIYYNLKNSIDPYSRKNGTYETDFSDLDKRPKLELDIGKTADILGINLVTATIYGQDELPEGATEFAKLMLDEPDGSQLQARYYLKTISTKPLVEALSQVPRLDKNVNLGEWWINSDRSELIVRELPEIPPAVNFTQPEINNLKIEPTKISFSVDSPNPAPIFIKFTYSSYWVATGNGSYSQPVWVTPGYMFLWARGDVDLTWKTPSYLHKFGPMAAAALLLTVGLNVIWRRVE
ncbi:hypothetical protein HYU89_01035 [Candidatus Collierbacteria bacterium]|nr:hypothetical protein [Candidatus Collierbacteria bacterium]